MFKFCMFTCSKPVLQLSKCTVSNFVVGLFQDATVHDTNNIGQYRLGLQIDSLDRNSLGATEETRH